MRLGLALGVVVMSAIATGCVSLLDRVSYREMEPRLAYQGFSFDRPPNSNWYLLRGEEKYTDVTLRREMNSETHSFYVRVALAGIARTPASHEDFAALIQSEDERRKASYEVTQISYEQRLAMQQNQWCIRFQTLAAIRGAPAAPAEELQMTIQGFRCLHPAFPNTTIDFFYSERGRPSEFDSALAEEGEHFLRGVRIDVAPGIPAA